MIWMYLDVEDFISVGILAFGFLITSLFSSDFGVWPVKGWPAKITIAIGFLMITVVVVRICYVVWSADFEYKRVLGIYASGIPGAFLYEKSWYAGIIQ